MATDTAREQLYIWRGTDPQGRASRGEIESISVAMARAQLRRQGIRPQAVRKKPRPLWRARSHKITPRDIALFTRQLATMMKAGVPLVQGFDIVAASLSNPPLQRLVLAIKHEVAAGSGLALTLARYPRYFDALLVNLVAAGEASGTLATMLDRVATYQEKSAALKAKIRKALTYPCAVVCVALLVSGLLLVKVVPQFATTFSGFGAELPAFTRFVLTLSDAAQDGWFIILSALLVAFVLHRQLQQRSPAFRRAQDQLLLRLPIIGNIVFNAIIARFARTLGTTFAAGVPLVEALDSVAGAAGNIIYSEAIKQIRDELSGGATLHQSIRNTGLFPAMLLQMVAIGEEAGALDDMLAKVADFYEDAVDNAVESLSSLLEPVIMAILGILVGGLMIAMYLPIFMLGSVV